MVIVEPVLNTDNLTKLRNNVLSKLGYDDNFAENSDVKCLVDKSIQTLTGDIEAKGVYRFVPAAGVKKNEIAFENGSINSHMFARLVDRCGGKKFIVFMIATAGEEWKKNLTPGDSIYLQMVFDTLGSELAEVVADMVEERWREEADQRGLMASWRFSPGYCDWDLKEQNVIFKMLDADKIGVKLSPHYVMTPSKSVSAIAVMADNVPVLAPCSFCAKDCIWRRLPQNQPTP